MRRAAPWDQAAHSSYTPSSSTGKATISLQTMRLWSVRQTLQQFCLPLFFLWIWSWYQMCFSTGFFFSLIVNLPTRIIHWFWMKRENIMVKELCALFARNQFRVLAIVALLATSFFTRNVLSGIPICQGRAGSNIS